MAVVGSDTNGTACNWEGNFALAMILRQKLNRSCEGIARPVYLRRSSFNQELAPYSLLLEIGTGANTLEEAKRTVQRVGDALAEIIRFN
jgi:stage II sporulation protein P